MGEFKTYPRLPNALSDITLKYPFIKSEGRFHNTAFNNTTGSNA